MALVTRINWLDGSWALCNQTKNPKVVAYNPYSQESLTKVKLTYVNIKFEGHRQWLKILCG